MLFKLPPLTYAYDAMEPYIDEATMKVHHQGHHQTYVSKLNECLKEYPHLQSWSLEQLLMGLDRLPDDIRTGVKNNGGGHFNHSFFWKTLAPKNRREPPSGELIQAISHSHADFATFQDEFEEKAEKHFASGWAWVCIADEGVEIFTSKDHECPLTLNKVPILVLDLWEHAYYLKYQNRRKEFINAFWNIVDWSEVGRRYNEADVGLQLSA